MVDQVVKTRLMVDASGAMAGFKRAALAAADYRKSAAGSIKQHSAEWDDLASKAAIGGAAVGLGVGKAVASFADFDSAMSMVQVGTGAAGAELESLRTLAMDLGADTKFSATEAAQGIEELGKAGVATSDIMGGALKGALDLAAAGGMEVADAAELTATTLTQFNLEGAQASHVADLLAAGAGEAQGSVKDMGDALNQSGLVASQMGLSVEETAGSLAMFANAGLTGSDAGTSFKTMLQRIQNPSKEAAAAMDEAGIAAYDAQGNFVGMSKVAEQMQTGMSGMSQAQRDAAMATIFGSDAIRAASVLYRQGAAGVDEWVAKVDDQGRASRDAATAMDNLKGDLEALGGALETALIGAGEGANGPLREAVQTVTMLVDAYNALPAPVKSATTTLAGVGAAGALGAAGLVKLVQGAQATREALDAIRGSASRSSESTEEMGRSADRAERSTSRLSRSAATLGKSLGSAGVGAAAMGGFFETLSLKAGQAEVDAARAASAVKDLGDSADKGATGISALKSAADPLGAVFGNSSANARYLVEDISRLANPDIGEGIGLWLQKTLQAPGQLKETQEAAQAAGDALAGMASSDLPAATEAFARLSSAYESTGGSAADLLTAMPAYKAALVDVAAAAKMGTDDATLLGIATGRITVPAQQADAAISGVADAAKGMEGAGAGALQPLAADLDAAKAEAEAAQKAMDSLLNAIRGLGGGFMSQIEAEAAFAEALAGASAAARENGSALTVQTAAGRANVEALAGVASAARDMAASVVESGGGMEAAVSAMERARASYISTAMSMGATRAEASLLADQMGLIPDAVATQFQASGVTAATTQTREYALAQALVKGQVNTDVSASGVLTAKGEIEMLDQAIWEVPREAGTTFSATGAEAVRGQAQAAAGAVKALPPSASVALSATGAGQAQAEIAGVQAAAYALTDEEVVRLQAIGGQITRGEITSTDQVARALTDSESISLIALGGAVARGEIGSLDAVARALTDSETVAVTTTAGTAEPAVWSLQGAINSLRGKTVSIVTQYIHRGRPTAGGQGGSGGLTPYATGGYTGPGHWLKEAGVVHAGEYVMPKRLTDRYRRMFEAIHRGVDPLDAALRYRRGYATGGYVDPIRPYTRPLMPPAAPVATGAAAGPDVSAQITALVAQVAALANRPVSVQVDSREIAWASNTGMARVGARMPRR